MYHLSASPVVRKVRSQTMKLPHGAWSVVGFTDKTS